jgi:hypothetical protein
MKLTPAFAVSCLVAFSAMVGVSAGAEGDPLAAKVTLTKPYHVNFEGAKTDKISIQFAVIELAKQAGLGYDSKTSLANTKPTCAKWIRPHIEGVPLREALDEILKPEGLGYEVHEGKVVLVKQSDSAGAVYGPLDTKVTLTKPYHVNFEGAKAEKIPIQYAVIELAQQAGLGYDFKTSLANTNQTCAKWITPQIEAITLREALDEILKPEGLGYEVHEGKVVLTKK